MVDYFSRQTSLEHKYYHSYEMETLAVVLALRHFRVYLFGIEFNVVTYCNAVRTAFFKKDMIPIMARWWLEVRDFNFEVRNGPEAKMTHVDALNRNPVNEEIVTNKEYLPHSFRMNRFLSYEILCLRNVTVGPPNNINMTTSLKMEAFPEIRFR